jgi:hypothetical protein
MTAVTPLGSIKTGVVARIILVGDTTMRELVFGGRGELGSDRLSRPFTGLDHMAILDFISFPRPYLIVGPGKRGLPLLTQERALVTG